MNKDFEYIPHTADLKIRVYGKTLHEFFRNAVIGMFQSIGPQSSNCTKQDDRLVCPALPEHRMVEMQAPDLTMLLIDFLSEALYLSDINNEAYLDVDVQEVDEQHIKAVLHGIKIKRFDVVEIKAVTYHDLKIQHIDGIWRADIVFDI